MIRLTAQEAAVDPEPGSPSFTTSQVVQLASDNRLSDAMNLLFEATAASEVGQTADAAAAVYRHLMQLPTDDRYQLLKTWTFPEQTPTIVRYVSGISIVDAPPKEFARAIGERPRKDTFSTPQSAGIDGLFSTAWLLVNAAQDAGRLRDLGRSLEGRMGSGAKYLSLITRIVTDRDGSDQELPSDLKTHVDGLEAAGETKLVDAVVIAAVCLANKHHAESGKDQISTLLNREQESDTSARELLQRMHDGNVSAAEIGGSEIDSQWLRISGDGSWIAHEGHFRHRSATPSRYLFRYPIAGDFGFELEEVGAKHDPIAGLIYQGRVKNGGAGYRRAGSNHRSITARGEYCDTLFNRHPVQTTWSETTSPWIGMAPSVGTTFYRNIRLTGDVTIPAKVELLKHARRDGWRTRRVEGDKTEQDSDDSLWSCKGGVLNSAANESTDEAQRVLQYGRPLLAGETFSYEFYLDADIHVAHPTLGRLAFLIKPDGIDLHWITDGDNEWTGLSADNSITEPLSRRGPKPLPLRQDQWNRIEMSIAGGKVSISLNASLVYQRKIERQDDTRFGLFDNRQTGNPQTSRVMVRGAALTGDWPADIESAKFAGPKGRTETTAADSFPEQLLVSNSREILRRASLMIPVEQFEFLADWVLPSRDRPTFRLQGEISQLHPVPDEKTLCSDIGSEVLAPALALVAVASETKRLDEIVERANAIDNDDPLFSRAREAMLTLIEHARGDDATVVKRLESLYRLTEESGFQPMANRWPELLVASQVAELPPAREIVRDLITVIRPREAKQDFAVATKFQSLLSALRIADEEDFRDAERIELKHWIPTSRFNASSRAAGHPQATWVAVDGCVQAIPGHSEDMLIYDVPLQGDYEVVCDTAMRTHTECRLSVGGLQTLFHHWKSTLRTGSHDLGFDVSDVQPPMKLKGNWLQHRYVVKDGIRKVYINGRMLDEREVPVEGFPWLAIRNPWQNFGSVRDLRILGEPTIPTELNLTTKKLIGWRPYYSYSVNTNNLGWSCREDGEIIGERNDYPPKSGFENLLYYQRPIAEDGTIAYEFYYEPGKTLVHPSLDRSAFILQPERIDLHSVTDGIHDRTSVSPLNLRDLPESRRGSGPLPLRVNAWNRMEMIVQGDTLRLRLNDQDVLQREIEPNNQRLFGLFYFADETQCRVRRVIYRGDWPRTLPKPREQQLSDKKVFELDDDAEKLAAKFEHDFTTDGLPDNFFRVENAGRNWTRLTPAGIEVHLPSTEKWIRSHIGCSLRAVGDFDIVVDYSGLAVAEGGNGTADLVARFTPNELRVHALRAIKPTDSVVTAQRIQQRPDGSNEALREVMACEATSGALRLARRASDIYVLASNGDSDAFRLVGKHQASAFPTAEFGICLNVVAQQHGRSAITWKKLRIHADKLLVKDGAAADRRIYVMNADGTDVKPLIEDPKIPGDQLFPSPSVDGSMIAYESYNDDPRNSHIVVVNADGSNQRDLGIGCLPTFTPDGKQIAIASFSGHMLMKIDGSNRELFDRSGWSIEFSPDGKKALNYTWRHVNGQRIQNLALIDSVTRRRTLLLEGEHASRYTRIAFNADWSPDSKEICFIGQKIGGGSELVVAMAAGSSKGLEVLLSGGEPMYETAWSPDGKQILYSKRVPSLAGSRLFLINRDDPNSERLLPGQPMDQDNRVGHWSRNGKKIFFTSQALAEYKTQ